MGAESKNIENEVTLDEAISSIKKNLNTPLSQDTIDKINGILEGDVDQEEETPRKIASPSSQDLDI